ncbi:MAG: adenylate/guanylate cyclase domain-containing protein [Pseudomonadota bacterium]
MSLLEGKLRLITGLVLSVYVIQHFFNHAVGLVSFEAAETFRDIGQAIFNTPPGQVALYSSFLFHGLYAYKILYKKASLRMPFWQWMQIGFGLSIMPLLIGHIISTRGLNWFGDVEVGYTFITTAMWTNPWRIPQIALLGLVVWVHMVIGLHYWLRLKQAYRRTVQYLYALAVLIPTLAIAGLTSLFKEALGWMTDGDRVSAIFADVRAMDSSTLQTLLDFELKSVLGMTSLLVLVLLARKIRLWRQLRKGTYTIAHSDGRDVRAQVGWSLLEALRTARIPHASVCGGRGRCTTCRVRVGRGLEKLEAPGDLESAALARINAAENVRLACQTFPRDAISVSPLVLSQQPVSNALHAGGVQGHEEYVVAMFVDMRGSTAIGERSLAYDVVFILNRFFTELSLALEETNGHYAQFAGDGLMALYGIGTNDPRKSCSDALAGAKTMADRLAKLNVQLKEEFGETIKMGIGIHGGEAIVGTMGPPKTPLLTAIGDNINIAARLESQTKQNACDVIVSAETLAQGEIDYSNCTTASLPVRGRESQVKVCLFNHGDIAALVENPSH